MPTASRHPDTALAVFLAFTQAGLQRGFGEPIAHLGYFRDEFVRRRGWLSESSYADLVALCQFASRPRQQPGRRARPGPRRLSRHPRRLARFHLPSAVLLVLFALGLPGRWGALLPEGRAA